MPRHILAAALLLLRASAPAGELGHAPAARLVPAYERPLDLVVVGTSGTGEPYFMLPDPGPMDALPAAARAEVAAELFALDVELSHGALFRVLPKETQLLVAVPETKPGAPDPEALFRRYLTLHAGWSAADVARRVRFFAVPAPVVFTRDGGKVLGGDARGHLRIATSLADRAVYQDFANLLAERFPARFTLHRLDRNASAEGGDSLISRMPDGSVALLVGHHRLLRYFGRDDRAGLADDEIARARSGYAQSLFGTPVLPVPEWAAKDPASGTPELFHLDMIVAVHGRGGVPDVFVPTYGPSPVDRSTGEPVGAELVQRAQSVFDRTAAELEARGFRVSRVPFEDHPVRGPANVVAYVDAAGQPSMLVAKYPYHLPQGDPATPLARFRSALRALSEEVEYLKVSNRKDLAPRWRAAFAAAWSALAEVERMPSPELDAQRHVFEARGYRVVEVPMLPWGGGGLHCLVLR